MRASSCRRAAIEPGKRWMAGGVDAIAANSSGSAAALASGSTVPKRSRTFAGPRKACSIGYCWSSIMPTRSANAESSRTLSAAGSPVIWKPMGPSCPTWAPPRGARLLGLDRQDRAGSVEEHALGVAAEDELADGRASAQADHQQLGTVGLGDADQVLGGLEAADELADVVLDAGLLEPLLDPGHLVLGGPGGGSVVVLPTPVGVHHDQLAPAQLGLVDTGSKGGLTLRLGDVSDDDGAHGVSSRGRGACRWPAGTVTETVGLRQPVEGWVWRAALGQ